MVLISSGLSAVILTGISKDFYFFLCYIIFVALAKYLILLERPSYYIKVDDFAGDSKNSTFETPFLLMHIRYLEKFQPTPSPNSLNDPLFGSQE